MIRVQQLNCAATSMLVTDFGDDKCLRKLYVGDRLFTLETSTA